MGTPGVLGRDARASFTQGIAVAVLAAIIASTLVFASAANAAPDPVRVESSPSERVFSPNGDGYEDVWSDGWSLSEAATVSVLVTDGAGVTVRSLLVDQPEDTNVSVSWNGLDDFGVLVPEGIYTARLTATDAQGDVATSSRRVGVSQKVPGVWTSPAAPGWVLDVVSVWVGAAGGVDVEFWGGSDGGEWGDDSVGFVGFDLCVQ